MHRTCFFLACALILMLVSPAAGSLTKIAAGAPVYIGEQNLNIAAGLQGCRVLEWFAPGADTSGPSQKNVTIIKTLEDSNIAFSYTIQPEIYTGYEGNWYCEGQRPLRSVFNVTKPEISIRFWDVDKDEEVSGMTIPITANITYRIDTNLDKALQPRYRPDMNPLDSFYTVKLVAPGNIELSSVYTGSYGKPDTVGLVLDKHPLITASPFFWKDGTQWDRTSRNIQGDLIYPVGTYSVSVTQDLSHMRDLYIKTSPGNLDGILESSDTVTFIKPASTPVPATSAPVTTTITGAVTTAPPVTSAAVPTATTPLPTRTAVPTKTTFAPLPIWIVAASLGIAAAFVLRQRK